MNLTLPSGLDIHYECRGDGPWLTLAHPLASNFHVWDPQVDELSRHFSVLRFDLRGHGRSGLPPPPWSFAELVRDVIGLWDALGIERSHYVGLSIGGMVGQHLALDHPGRLDRLVLCATSSGDNTHREAVARLWAQRISQVQQGGMAAVLEGTLSRWFTEPFRCEAADVVGQIAAGILTTPPAGYAACGQLVAAMDTSDRLGQIQAPTLVLGGEDDPGATPATMTALARAIPGARLEILPQAAHLLNVEQDQLFNALLLAFLTR